MQLDADVLKDLRERTRSFIKLDRGYLAAGWAIITALKIGRSELVEFGAQVSGVAFALVLIISIDVYIDSMVFNDWLVASTSSGKREPLKRMQRLLNIQSFLHVTFVVGLIVYATGFALGSQSVRKELEARVILQEVVDSFLQKEGRSPKNIEELTKVYPRSTLAIENLAGEKVVLESTGARSYKLTFAG